MIHQNHTYFKYYFCHISAEPIQFCFPFLPYFILLQAILFETLNITRKELKILMHKK